MEQPPAIPPPRKRPGSIGAAVAALIAFGLKFKLALLVGLKLLAPSWTFLVSLWVAVLFFGWRLALVLMLVLLAHELGHYFAFRAYGLQARLPAFIPLLGAFTAGTPAANLEDDAYIALAGPLTGLGLAGACLGMGMLYNHAFWAACASLSAFLNLFNMIPMPPFDGGRVIAALWPPLWLGGTVLFVTAAAFLHVPLLLVAIVALLGAPEMIAVWRGRVDPRAASMTTGARLRVSLWYLIALTGLIVVLGYARSAGPGALGA